MSNDLYLHMKTNNIYRLIGIGRIEASMDACAIYTDHPESKQTWVRPQSEFFDGRFTPIGHNDDDIFDPLADIEEFHEKFGLDCQFPMGALDEETMAFRHKFLKEELYEWYQSQQMAMQTFMGRDDAEYTHHLEKTLDGLVDMAYVLFGTVYLHGFKDVFAEAWRRVHEANMKKVRAELLEDSTRGSTMDVVKPAGWEPPYLTDLVEDNDNQNRV